jgi:hypothetical protein
LLEHGALGHWPSDAGAHAACARRGLPLGPSRRGTLAPIGPCAAPPCHHPARPVRARRVSTPRHTTSGCAAVPRPASSLYTHRAAPELLLAITPRTAFAPYRVPSPEARAPTKGAGLAGCAHCALAEPLPPRHGCPAHQALGSAPFPNHAVTHESSLGPVDELVVSCCLGPATSSPEQPLPRRPSPDHATPALRPPPRGK